MKNALRLLSVMFKFQTLIEAAKYLNVLVIDSLSTSQNIGGKVSCPCQMSSNDWCMGTLGLDFVTKSWIRKAVC